MKRIEQIGIFEFMTLHQSSSYNQYTDFIRVLSRMSRYCIPTVKSTMLYLLCFILVHSSHVMSSPTKSPEKKISKGSQGIKSSKTKVFGTPTPRKSSKRLLLVTPRSKYENKGKVTAACLSIVERRYL